MSSYTERENEFLFFLVIVGLGRLNLESTI